MTIKRSGRGWVKRSCRFLAACLVGAALGPASASAAGSADAYATTQAVDLNPDPGVFETKIVAQHGMFDIGNGAMAHGMTFNGTVPGPRIEVEAGVQLIVHFYNETPHPTAIHWHGIELNNQSDGTGVSQDAVPSGGYFRYQFTQHRPGTFWYHPHHSPTNPVFQGQYGMLVVTEPAESALIAQGVLPGVEDTHAVVLSDTTVCKAPGSNDAETWPGHAVSPTPKTLCETKPRDDHGGPRDAPFAAGEIPNIQPDRQCTSGCWVNPGQTVLTNGKVASGRSGSPAAPGALAPGYEALGVQAGQGVRLRLLAATTFRYLRLRLTDATGRQIPLYRVGGEGGLIDRARLEGGAPGGFDTKYGLGEILLAPSDRADVVFAVPSDATGVLTLWTQDFKQLGPAGPGTPTVPVMHFEVGGATAGPFTIAEGDPIRTHPVVDDPVEDVRLWEGLDWLLDPAAFSPPKPGTTNARVSLNTANGLPAIDGIAAEHEHLVSDYTEAPFVASTRYARVGDTLELSVTNTDGMHHPFHEHGFSFQPIAFVAEKDERVLYEFPYREFMDTIDIPPHTTVRLRLELEDRPLADDTTGGGATGRWLFHCHIFHHASLGMMGELVVVGQNDSLPPAITADEPFPRVQSDERATNHGAYRDPDGDPVTLSANVGDVTDQGGGRWSWTFDGAEAEDDSRTVVITATDANGTGGQVAFDLADDVAAPVTTLATNPAAPDGADGWFTRSSVAVALTADDGHRGFGVDRTEYRIDGGDFRDYAGPFDVSGPGKHLVEYRSTDRKGNVEETKSATVAIDAGAPATTHTLDPASPDAPLGLLYLSPVTVTLSASDQPNGSGVARTEYRIDDGPLQKYEGPFTVTGIGMRTVTYRSRDAAGNAEPDKTVSWTQLAL